jgi:hypothetical protein
MDKIKREKLKIAIKVAALNKSVARFWGDYYFAMALLKCFKNAGHSVRVDLFSDWYSFKTKFDDVVLVLRGLREYKPRKRHYNIMWNISHPDKVTTEEYERYNHVYVASESYANELKKNCEPGYPLFFNALILIYSSMKKALKYLHINIYSWGIPEKNTGRLSKTLLSWAST